MGVNLKEIISSEPISFSDLSKKTIAVDAFNTIYQFLSSIRQADGTPLMDSRGEVTSHLSGLLYRTTNLIKLGIKPVYVFDGEAPALKRDTLRARKERKLIAEKQWIAAKEDGRIDDAKKFAKRTSKITEDMIVESKILLTAMGVPWVQAPSEAEAQCTRMVERKDAWAVATMDYDSLLFGAKRVIRGFTMSGKIELSIIELEKALAELGITREQLIDVAILCGTDFDKGVYGIGPKKALKSVKDGTVDSHEMDFDINEVREIFRNHKVTDDYDVSWGKVNENKLSELLHEKHNFSADRVKNAANQLEKAYGENSQKSLDAWF